MNRGNIECIVRGSVNYIWNFVKVMVDVYNGMMKFFVVDENDLVLNIYWKIFFKLFIEKFVILVNVKVYFCYFLDLFKI